MTRKTCPTPRRRRLSAARSSRPVNRLGIVQESDARTHDSARPAALSARPHDSARSPCAVALPPPSRRLRGRLRCGAFSAPAAPAQASRRLPARIPARLRVHLAPRVHARHRASRLRAHCLRRVRTFLLSKRTPAHARVRLPLRWHRRPPSPCRAGRPRSASPLPRALTGLWRALLHNAGYAQRRRWPRSRPSRSANTTRGHHRHRAFA